MSFLVIYANLIEKVYKVSNPIIKYRIDTELYEKKDISIEHYFSIDNTLIFNKGKTLLTFE